MAKIITPEAIISYPKLDEPESFEGGDAKFSCALVFLEGTDLTEMKGAVAAVAKEKWGDKAGGMFRSGALRSPFRTDAEAKGYPEGSTFFNARSKQRPGTVSQVPDAEGKPTLIEASVIYAGCIVKAFLSIFAYDKAGNKGISFGLEHVQFIREGERLDGRVAAADVFAADADAVADLSDLEGSDDVAIEPEAPAEEEDLSDLM